VLDRIPPAQRRLVALTALVAVLAGIFVAVAVILATGQQAVAPDEYEPFRVGRADVLVDTVRDRPVFFADPTGGERGFAFTLHEGDFLALHVVPPGGSAECPVDWSVEASRFEDCEGQVHRPEELARFQVRVVDEGDEEIVLVDLRRRLPAPSPRDA